MHLQVGKFTNWMIEFLKKALYNCNSCHPFKVITAEHFCLFVQVVIHVKFNQQLIALICMWMMMIFQFSWIKIRLTLKSDKEIEKPYEL